MIIKTIQWNIGGGRIRNESDNPAAAESYQQEGLEYIGEILEQYSPDVIFMQETHEIGEQAQAKDLAAALGLFYFFNDVYDRSHIDSEYGLGQAIISRWPIENHTFELFFNPKFEVTRPNGEKWISHNKGVSCCTVKAGDKKLVLKTLHLIPFRKFDQNPLSEELKELRQDIERKIMPNQAAFLLHGDFNWDEFSLKDFLPGIFVNGVQEVILTEPTTPKDRRYDHIVYKGLRHRLSKVVSNVLTDHYPVYSEFEI